MNTVSNITKLAFSNVLSFGASFIISFVLPKILSVPGYGLYKQYTLYLTMTYLFNFGFNDGINIKYGGRELSNLNKERVSKEHTFIVAFQVLVLIVMIFASYIINDKLIGFFAIATFFNTLISYHQNFNQAIGVFDTISKGNILNSIFYISMLLIGILVFNVKQSDIFIIINIISFFLLFLYLEFHYKKNIGYTIKFDLKYIPEIFRVGIFILIANMSLTFVGSIGNWIVNWRYSLENFAQYSFQNSLLNVILLLVNAIGVVFYNVLAKNRDIKLARMLKTICIFLGIISGLGFFVLKFIVLRFLPNYKESIGYLSITFISIPYLMVSRILIANLFKTMKSEKQYFVKSMLYALIALLFVGLTEYIFKSVLSITVSTTACYILWYLYTTRIEFSDLKDSKKEYLLLFSHIVVFYLVANKLNLYLGIILYLVYCILIIIANNNNIKEIINFIRKN